MLKITIISGGQTGVDRATLDVALALGLPCGGWSPNRRRLENGAIPAKYPLREMPSPKYPPRTAKNVREADGTVILTRGGDADGRDSPDRQTGLGNAEDQLERLAIMTVDAGLTDLEALTES